MVDGAKCWHYHSTSKVRLVALYLKNGFLKVFLGQSYHLMLALEEIAEVRSEAHHLEFTFGRQTLKEQDHCLLGKLDFLTLH